MSRNCFVCCNQCFGSNSEIQHKFYITNCYHVFCAGCLANNKNFCGICKKKCKALAIDENLPKEVRIYFDPNAHQELLKNLVKVHEFQQTQAKSFIQKNYYHRKQYYQAKEKIIQMQKYKKRLIENIKREKHIMEKLKDGYRTNVISPSLFQLRSQSSSSGQMDTSSRHNSGPSTMFHNRQSSFGQSSERMNTSSNLTLSNFSRGTEMQNHLGNDRNKMMMDTRKGLVAMTMRDMNQVTSQARTQTHRTQNNRNYKRI